MLIKNNSHYFNAFSKLFNFVPDNNSFPSQSCRRMGFYQRLYFEFLYTKSVGGYTFFYTLTYNDRSIPIFLGKPVFNYNDIRYITNGALPKILKRKYGSRLKYFCACETGDGKGKRGLGNNPHYHFIFFVQPLHDKSDNPIYDGYKPISSFDFKDLIQNLWHGQTGYVDFKLAKFGICQPGKFNGVVDSPSAFKYVGKYCVKSSLEFTYESHFSEFFRKKCIHDGITYDVLYAYYKYLRQTSLYTKKQFVNMLDLISYNHFKNFRKGRFDISYRAFIVTHPDKELKQQYMLLLDWFNSFYVDLYVNRQIQEYRNHYSSKPRLSKSLGVYGLKFVQYIKGEPCFRIPEDKLNPVQHCCMYYIRHLFYDVTICQVTGNPLYRLNQTGIDYKVNNLENKIHQFSSKVHNVITNSFLNPVFDEKMRSQLSDLIHRFDYDYIRSLYSVWHFVYQYRSSVINLYESKIDASLSMDSIKEDYRNFLFHSSFWLDFEESSAYLMLSKCTPYTYSFRNHEVFCDYVSLFDLLDTCLDLYSSFKSDLDKADFEAKSNHQKLINSFNFNMQYG